MAVGPRPCAAANALMRRARVPTRTRLSAREIRDVWVGGRHRRMSRVRMMRQLAKVSRRFPPKVNVRLNARMTIPRDRALYSAIVDRPPLVLPDGTASSCGRS